MVVPSFSERRLEHKVVLTSSTRCKRKKGNQDKGLKTAIMAADGQITRTVYVSSAEDGSENYTCMSQSRLAHEEIPFVPACGGGPA